MNDSMYSTPDSSSKIYPENVILSSVESNQSEMIEDSHLVRGVILIHLTFKSYELCKKFDIKTVNLQNVCNDLNIYFKEITNHLEKRIEEEKYSPSLYCTLDNKSGALKSENIELVSKSLENEMISNGGQHKKDKSIQYNEDDFKLRTSPGLESKLALECVPLKQGNSLLNYRFSTMSTKSVNTRSSTSTSIDATSSSSHNRFSTTSISTNSGESIDLITNEKRDSILVANTSDSSIDNTEPTFIGNSDDEEKHVKVYAKWKREKYFYAGTVKVQTFQQEVPVLFADDTTDEIKFSDILFMEFLPINTMVLVDLENTGSFNNKFVISGYADIQQFKRKSKKGYSVLSLMDNREYTVSRDLVCVHHDVAKDLISRCESLSSEHFDCMNASVSNVSVENIIHGKRNIKIKRFSQFVSPDMVKVKRCNSPSLLTISTSPGKYKSALKRRKNMLMNVNTSFDMGSSEEHNLFKNFYFMVTHELIQNDTCNQSKDYVEDTIQGSGGQIIETPNKTQIEAFRRKECQIVLIVLGESYNTIKFMVSLAVGNVPVVRHEWLQQCIKAGSIVPYESFLVSRGMDENGREIPQTLNHQRTIPLFENKRIWIVTDSVHFFGAEWKKVLSIAGAEVTVMNVSDYTSNISVQNCDLAFTERDGVSKNCINYLKERGVQIVCEKYIINCFIQNKLLEVEKFVE